MSRLTLIAALLLTAVAAHPAAVAQPRTNTQAVDWSFDHSDEEPRLEFSRRGTRSSVDPATVPDIVAKLTSATTAVEGSPVAFDLVREAGKLVCSGMVSEDHTASGKCRFDPSSSFPAALAQKGITLEDKDDLLGLTLVDAKLVSVEMFSNAGLALADSDDLMTVSALHVTPAYRDELRSVGIEIDTVSDLVAARAVGVEGAWLAAMAEAGYPARDARQAIEMRALDITPDYARRMARVMASAEVAARP